MTITVAFIAPALTIAAVCVHPSWIDRVLFGARSLEDMACAAADPSGGRLWLWDSTGRRISNRRIVAVIERARSSAEAAQRREVTA